MTALNASHTHRQAEIFSRKQECCYKLLEKRGFVYPNLLIDKNAAFSGDECETPETVILS